MDVLGSKERKHKMPTRLPSGTVIFNATPHPLNFYDLKEEKVTLARPDAVINTRPVEQVEGEWNEVTFVKVTYSPEEKGLKLIDNIRLEYPDIIIVGSVLAAMAYPGEVVASIPLKGSSDRLRSKTSSRRVCSDRFTIFNSNEEQQEL